MVSLCPIAHASYEQTAPYTRNYFLEEGNMMPIYLLSVKVAPTSETELKEVATPDFRRKAT